MRKQKLSDTHKKRLILKDLKKQFPEMENSELEVLLLDLKRIPELFKKLITETQVNLRVYERYKKVKRGQKKSKKVGTDYKLDLDTFVGIKDGQPRRK
ncbi:MAG TPA: hypothetical protein VMX76_02795 [Nevskiaceae bacterium]|nr:hypothetical protein [Nevskiaceae bacterium]